MVVLSLRMSKTCRWFYNVTMCFCLTSINAFIGMLSLVSTKRISLSRKIVSKAGRNMITLSLLEIVDVLKIHILPQKLITNMLFIKRNLVMTQNTTLSSNFTDTKILSHSKKTM